MNYYDFGLCEGLSCAGAEVTLYTCNETKIPSNTRFQVICAYQEIYGSKWAMKRGFRFILGTIRALWHAKRIARADVCHFHFFHGGVFEGFMVLMARLFGMPVVITAHDVESFGNDSLNLRLPFSKLAYCCADRVIGHNYSTCTALATSLGVPEKKMTVIPHGNYLHVIRDVPLRKDARKELGIGLNKKILLFFGQIKRAKGLDLLIRAMPEVVAEHPDVLLLIAGKTWRTDFSQYQEQINVLGIREQCLSRIQYIPDSDVPLYYAACDLVVLPYRKIYQSGVLLMAMSYGRPILASDLPGMAEVIDEGETGFLFPSENAYALSNKIIQLLNDPEDLEHVARKGLQHMKECHSWFEVGRQTHTCYETILSYRRAA